MKNAKSTSAKKTASTKSISDAAAAHVIANSNWCKMELASKKTAAKKVAAPVAKKVAAKVAPVVDKKMAAANDVELTAAEKKAAVNLADLNRAALKPEAVATVDAAVASINAITPETPAEDKAAVIEKAVADVKAANAPKAKKEKLTLPKLRRVGDIMNALRNGAWIVREDGLYRLSLKDGQRQPVSKRRCVAMIHKEVVRPLAAGMSKGFVSAWELAPEAPKEEKK